MSAMSSILLDIADRAHRAHIDHDAVLDQRPAIDRMALPARCQLDAVVLGPAHQARNFDTRRGPDYAAWLPVNEAAEIVSRCGAHLRLKVGTVRNRRALGCDRLCRQSGGARSKCSGDTEARAQKHTSV